MHRRPLLELLDAYEAQFPEESATTRIRALVKAAPDCFERTCRPGHVTGSAWVVSSDRRRCLLVHHRKLGKWLQPGGHADGDSEVSRVAFREAVEESGLKSLLLVAPVPLDLDVHVIPARRDVDGNLLEDAHEHHDVRFLVQAKQDEMPTVSEESHDVRWFTEQELLAATAEESVLRLWRKAATFFE